MSALQTFRAQPDASLRASDILPNHVFESVRPSLRPLVQELRRRRRHRIGPTCTILFENRETVLWQIQEVLRVENRFEPRHVAEELARYEPLVPRRGELRATVLVDGGQPEQSDALCDKLGTDPTTLELRVGDRRCFAECVDDDPHVCSPVRYVCFDLACCGIQPNELANRPAELVMRALCIRIEAIPQDMRRALATDLHMSRYRFGPPRSRRFPEDVLAR